MPPPAVAALDRLRGDPGGRRPTVVVGDQVGVVVHGHATAAHLAEDGVLLGAHQVRSEGDHGGAPDGQVAEDEEAFVGRTCRVGSVAPTHRPRPEERGQRRTLDHLEAAAAGWGVVGSAEHARLGMAVGQLHEEGQRVGLEGGVVVDEEEQAAPGCADEEVAGGPGQRPDHQAHPGLGEAGGDGLGHLPVAVGADQDLVRRRVDLRLDAGQAGVEQAEAATGHDADGDPGLGHQPSIMPNPSGRTPRRRGLTCSAGRRAVVVT